MGPMYIIFGGVREDMSMVLVRFHGIREAKIVNPVAATAARIENFMD
jgi:hypothetical protein